MNKNILAENMRRFGTKNLTEQPAETPIRTVDSPYEINISPSGVTMTPTEKTILAANDGDPKMEQYVADWIATQPDEAAAQRYIQQIAKQKPQLFKRILQFFERNKTNDELRRKQVRQATRRYRAGQIDGDKVAQGAGMAGTAGAVLMLTFGKLGDMFLKALGKEGGNFYSKE